MLLSVYLQKGSLINIEMYTKNNLNSLGKLHSNALMKSQSPTGLKSKPLSQIQNSLQKLKAKKRKSKSKSKQNTPENQMSSQRRSSISNKKNNICFHTYQQKKSQNQNLVHSKKPIANIGEHINSIVSSYQISSIKGPSQISFSSRNLTDSNTTSCVSSQYQLPMNSQLSQKSVKFSERSIQFNMNRINPKKLFQKTQRQKTPSILKKKMSINSVNSQRSNSSAKSLTKVSRTKQLVDIQNVSSNKIIKSKYEALIKKYEDMNKRCGKNQIKNYSKLEKYTDDIFPPQNSSIFSYSIHYKTQKAKNLQWRRIPQIYPNLQLIVLRQENSKSFIKITKNHANKQAAFTEDYLTTSLNCIRQNKKILQKMFEIKSINLCGIYLVKIFQDNSWKYIVIDDFIPVFYDQAKETFYPAFANVQKAEGNTSDTFQIWPHLLQKAYAVYYSKYQALKFGTQIDCLQQLTGVPAHQIKIQGLNLQNKQHLQIQNVLRQERGIVLGQKIIDQKSFFYCILPDLNSITKKAQGLCTYLSMDKNYKPVKQKLQSVLNNLTKIYVFNFQMPKHLSMSFLCPYNKKSTQGSFKYKKQQLDQSKQDPEISLRFFKITQNTNIILNVKQKDRRFYFQGKFEYTYIWIRVIILMKQHNEDYRWIDGLYSNRKSLSFHRKLQPGQYYLLLMPEWNSSYKYDLSINLFTQNASTVIQKKPYLKNSQIFEKGCADIAQRIGSMNQINKYICAYNYMSKQTGLVVQNINNQRQNGPVTVMRSINGLKCQVSLVPVNKQFYYMANQQYENEAGKKLKKTIEVDIEANQYFTVVLKTMGGIDNKFFDSFDFGC